MCREYQELALNHAAPHTLEAEAVIVLGVNMKLDGHDPAAALLINGRLVAAAEEERFVRVKHAPGMVPHNTIAWCLSDAGISIDDVDIIALGWDPRRQPDAPEPSSIEALRDLLLPLRLFPRRRAIPIERVPHHCAHAAGAFYASQFDNAVALVIDGSSERESISAFRCQPSKIELLWSLPFANSLGFFYEALTLFVGLGKYEEGKTMGLAPYGRPLFALPSVLEEPPVEPVAEPDSAHYIAIVRAWIKRMEQISGVSRNPQHPRFAPVTGTITSKAAQLSQIYKDMAYAGQQRLENDMLLLTRKVLRETGCSHLVLAGGVAYNCVANGKLARLLGSNTALYIQPAAGDAGVALGAAALISAQNNYRPSLSDTHVYSGPHYTQAAIADLLQRWGIRFEVPEDPIQVLIDDLNRDYIVAFFHGRAEIGPRALGARSLLANPSNPRMHDRVNRLKGREPWRPLAPSIPSEQTEQVFGISLHTPFMLLSYPTLPAIRKKIPAAIHVDGSTRPQILATETNPVFHQLLHRFTIQTGIPALLNTSFNVGEPIVATPAHAIRTFMTSGIDTLWLEGIIVRKTAHPHDAPE